MTSTKVIFLFLALLYFQTHANAQFSLGAGVKDANYMQKTSNQSLYSSLDYFVSAKYQYKNYNLALDYGQTYRAHQFDIDEITTGNDRVSLLLNYLQVKEKNEFSGELGVGYFIRIPNKLKSSSGIVYEKFYNSGIATQLAMNYFTGTGYFSIGIRSDIDIQNSIKNNNLLLKDYGLYLAAHIDILSLFKK